MTSNKSVEKLLERIQELEKEANDRKQVVEELLLDKMRLGSLIEHSSLAIVTMDYKHDIVSCNRDFEKLFQFKEDEIRGKKLDEIIVGKGDFEKAIAYTDKTISGEPIHGTGQRYNKDGNHIYVEFFGVPVIVDNKVVGAYGIYRDIHKRIMTENALRESEKKYRDILDSIEDGYFEVDIAGNFTFFNHSMARILGYLEYELLGMNNREYMDKENARKVYIAFNSVYRTGKPHRGYEWAIIRKDGATRYLETSVSLKKNSIGHPVGFQGIARDISDRKKAEEAVRESENKHKTLIYNIPGMVYRGYPDWSAEIISNSIEICGYSNDEINSKQGGWLSIIHPDDLERIHANGTKMADMPMTTVQIYRIIDKQGNTRWVEDHKTTVFSNANQISLIDGIVFDITDKVMANEALRESEKKYRTLLDGNPDPIVVYDMEGLVTYMNPAFTQTFGWSLKERFGKKMDEFVPDEAWTETRIMIDKVLAGERLSGTETTRYTKDGKKIAVSISGSILKNEKGEITASIINIRDISEQKKMEYQLQRAQKMEAIGTLAGGIYIQI